MVLERQIRGGVIDWKGFRFGAKAHLDIGERFQVGDERGAVAIGAALRDSKVPHLAHLLADPHGNAELFRFLYGERRVLGRNRHASAEVKAAGKHRTRELVARSTAARLAGIDDLQQYLRIKPALGSQDECLARRRHARRGEQVVQ
ncbi:hypothetical protein D3C86_1710710 [compost metagenome]